ncbi:MAG: TIR domain-containing protein [Casimicrobiaceae bacterium]
MDAATIDLTVFVERLRTAGFRVDTRQYLSANELLLAYAARGTPLDADVAQLASHLAPIFCTVPEEQQRFALEVAAWRGAGGPADAADEKKPVERPFAFWRRWRWRLVAIAVTVALLAGAGGRLYYQYREVTLEGAVMMETADGVWAPALRAQVRFRDSPVALDEQARFSITTTRAAGFGSLQADLAGYRPASKSASASMPQPIELKLRRLPPPPPPSPQQALSIGEPRAISLGTPTPEVRAGGPPWTTIALGSVEAALIALLLLGATAVARNRLALRRLNAAGDADEVTLTPPLASAVALSDHMLRRLASAWRRPREQATFELNPAATVDATLGTGGLFSPVYTARRATPEYLALVHRRSGDDHWSAYVIEWLDKLSATGVTIDVFTFHDDPRTCYSNDDKRRGQRLSHLAAQHHRATVLLFADAGLLFNPAEDVLDAWVATLHALPARVLFTAEAPYRWAHRERTLAAEGFVVLPANAEGFRLFAEMAGDWRIDRMFPAPYARAFPRMLAEEPLRWLDRNAPPNEDIEKLIRELRGYLGPDGFAWLCACAVYPQISWSLTLYLAGTTDTARRDEAMSAASASTLPALARLPWLRHGLMPDWLRRTLIARLSEQLDADVRRRVESLLEQLALAVPAASAKGAKAPTTRTHASALSISRWIGPVDLLRAAPAGSPLADRVFLGFMSGTNVDPLSVGVAASVRKLFARDVGAFTAAPDTPARRDPDHVPEQTAAAAADKPAPLRVFLNYRRNDTSSYAGRLSDTLRSRIPNVELFLDAANIADGSSWREGIERAIHEADVVLVLIGPRWLERGSKTGESRLFDEEDFVRSEIATALSASKRVIPILVGGARMPAEGELPADVAPLARLNALELHDDAWPQGVARLDETLETMRPKAAGASHATSQPSPVPQPPSAPTPSFFERARAAAQEGRQSGHAALARGRAWMAFHPAAFAGIASVAVGLFAMVILRAWLPPVLVPAAAPAGSSFAAFSADGRWLVTRNATGEAVLALARADPATSNGFVSLAGAAQDAANARDAETRILRAPDGYATAAAFADDNKVVAVGYSNGSERTFEVATAIVVQTRAADRPGAILALTTGGRAGLSPDSLWVLSGEQAQRVDLVSRFGVRSSEVVAASFDRDGTRFAMLFNTGMVRLFTSGTSSADLGFDINCATTAAPVFSPDGRRLACAAVNGGLLLWNVDSGTKGPEPAVRIGGPVGEAQSGPVTSAAFRPDSRVIAGARGTGEIDFWDVASGRLLASRRIAPSSRALATAFSPSGEIFVAAGIRDLEFWPLTSQESAAKAADLPTQQNAANSPPTAPGTDIVPSILRMTTRAALSALDRHQLILGSVQPRASSAPKDTIIAQDPPSGRRVATGTAVDVTVSIGPAQASDTAAPVGSPNAASNLAPNAPGTLRSDPQPSGRPGASAQSGNAWCCVRRDLRAQSNLGSIGGQVSQVSSGECEKIGGRFATTRDQADALCGNVPPAPTVDTPKR